MSCRILARGSLALAACLSLYGGCGRSSQGELFFVGGAAGTLADGGGVGGTGNVGTGGSPSSGGTGNAGSGGSSGTGGIDCSNVGCAPPPLCGSGCSEPCGCCPCGEGQIQGSFVCRGGCWAALEDGGAPDGNASQVDGTAPDAPPIDGGAADAEGGVIDCSAVGCSPPPMCDTGCTAPCGCCPCAEGEVIGAYICTGGCYAPLPEGGTAACQNDADCAAGFFCRATMEGGTECVPFSQEGETCGGYTAVWDISRCAPGLICTDIPPYIADASGICRVPCTKNGDCPGTSYCSPTNFVCRSDGACLSDFDCDAAGNRYAHAKCTGYGDCNAGACSWVCGDEQCRDLKDVYFGPCAALLGWAVQNGACVAISGCGDLGYPLFATESDCKTTCGL